VGVSMEDREVLLGHANHSMAGHYASARRRPAAQAGELDLEPTGNAYGATRRNRGNAEPVDKRSRRGPAARETTSIAARNPLNFGAPGRIRTHDPLVRR
jgi:hypothetical protein